MVKRQIRESVTTRPWWLPIKGKQSAMRVQIPPPASHKERGIIMSKEHKLNGQEFLDILNTGLEKHEKPSESSVHCNKCSRSIYVSEDEFAFMRDNRLIQNNIIMSHRISPHSQIYEHVEHKYSTKYCPHLNCERDKFGEASLWRTKGNRDIDEHLEEVEEREKKRVETEKLKPLRQRLSTYWEKEKEAK